MLKNNAALHAPSIADCCDIAIDPFLDAPTATTIDGPIHILG